MMSWSPSLSGRILTEKQPLWSMLPMPVTLPLSPSLTLSEQSTIRQTVVCRSVAIGETNPQDVFPRREGNGAGGGGGGVGPHPPLVAATMSNYAIMHLWAAPGADSAFSLYAHTQYQSWRIKPTCTCTCYIHDTKSIHYNTKMSNKT